MASVSLRIDLAGRVTRGAEEIEFEVVSGTADDVETTDADLSVNCDELYVIGVLDENVTTGEVEVDVSLMAEGDSLRLRSHSGVVGFQGKVTLNGDPIAILMSGEETEVEPAGAIRLSAEQTTLLRRLPGLVDRILELVRATAVAIELD